MVIQGHRINLRDRRSADLADHQRWRQPGQAWRNWDAPWETVPPLDAERSKKWLADLDGPRPEPRRVMEIETAQGDHIGWVGCYWIDEDGRWMDTGIVIAEPRLWEQGYGREAFSLWLDYLVPAHDLPRIGIGTWGGNERMIRLAARVGMCEEAHFADARLIDGERYDAVRWGVTRAEWDRYHAPRTDGLRRYIPRDWDAAVELTHQLYRHHRSQQKGPAFTKEDARESLYDTLAHREQVLWLWQESGEVIGLARARHEGVYFLEEFCVAEGHRGKGVGARFLAAIEDHLREIGEHDVFLGMVWPGNLRAIDFYRREGYDLINTFELRKGLVRDKRGRETRFLDRPFHLGESVP